MAWRTYTNFTNYGVYLMRHMKTYSKEGEKRWKCGFKSRDGVLCKQKHLFVLIYVEALFHVFISIFVEIKA